ncbi:MIP family channel protein [Lutimaribacter marinistellae]|uniref:MIP family channel protein n=1 Tax=Lutimaribacter marinistellae TaxID=1820329 RepID=A0ABV7TD04_9RHOB
MKKLLAEGFGTFTLVFFGVGSAVLAGSGVGLADAISITGISLAFGISVVAMAYSIGQVSGAHLNPAVSFGCLVAGRMSMADFIGYVIAQLAGAIIAALLIYMTVETQVGGYDVSVNGMGQNGWGEGFGAGYGLAGAFIFEFVATAVFIVVILGVTSATGNATMAGLVIGLTLTMIHLVGITITGTSVNPARSVGPALFAGGAALSQLWLFILAPLLGAGAGALIYKLGIASESDP